VVGVYVSTLGTGDQVECALVGVGDGVGATDRVIVGRADSVATDASTVHAVFATTVAFHIVARI